MRGREGGLGRRSQAPTVGALPHLTIGCEASGRDGLYHPSARPSPSHPRPYSLPVVPSSALTAAATSVFAACPRCSRAGTKRLGFSSCPAFNRLLGVAGLRPPPAIN